jgi:radical SAM family uncharacterized protein/radical SAM-linked protein
VINAKQQLIEILPTVSKPTRYLGDELNAVKKDPENPELIRFALAFPDIYDVGMSHLGLKILYHILNSRDDVWAERVYAPWVDMEKEMRSKGIPLFSLESASPLTEFDIIGFSLQYEMSYTSILNMLDLARIPLLSADRDESHPLIIAGGPCAFNPEPLSDFIDFFVIGDGEEAITEIVDCYKSHKNAGQPARKELLRKMAEIEGIYVPAFTSVQEQPDGTLAVSDSLKVRKRVVRDLDNAPYPVDYMVPFMRPIHDRAIIEVMRGCSRGCRFCQAGMIYRPVRERSLDVVQRLAEDIINETGYEELSLSSLSTCDHSSISEILQKLVETQGKEKHVATSLPSLRTDAFSVELARKLGSTGKTGLTFAPEVATQRMQSVINKNISRSEILSTVKDAFSTGWDSLKLYFMIGLPTETEEDVARIAQLVKEILNTALQVNRRASLNVSVSTFVPKAHTPFQWERQLSIDEIQRRQRLLMDIIGKNRRINLSFHSPQVSHLEGVFARGDRRLGQVLMAAHKLGCKLDGWTEMFNFDAWMQAFAQCGIDPDVYHRERKSDQVLPWDHIDTYLTKDFLLRERDKAYKAMLTPDCRWGECARCGICDQKLGRVMKIASQDARHKTQDTGQKEKSPDLGSSVLSLESLNIQHPASRIRFQFAKREEVKFISHLNMLNTFTRAFRRAGIPVAYSQGFNPHPKISFGSVLPVGTTSEVEVADIALEDYMGPEEFISRANAQLPQGLEILKAQEISLKEQPLMAQISLASYIVRVSGAISDVDSRISSILGMDHIWIERQQKRSKRPSRRSRRKAKTSSFIDIKPRIRNIRLLKHTDKTMDIEMVLGDSGSGKIRPEEVIRIILDGSVEDVYLEKILSSTNIQKTGSFIEYNGELFSPMEITNQ